MSKYAFLRTKVSFAIIGMVIGLVGGFKLANSQYRAEQTRAMVAGAASRGGGGQAAAQAGMQPGGGGANSGEVQAILDKARANPNDAEAQMTAATQFIQIERPQDAMPFLTQANKVKPNDPRVMAGLGIAQFMLGNLEEAATWLKRSRDGGATEPTVTSLLVGAYIQSGKNLDEAERLLKELEGQGIDPTRLAQIREDLTAARSGKRTPPPPAGGKTMLNHGPETSGGKN